MGYDRLLLRSLRDVMHRSVGELERIRSSDPEAAAAMRSVRSIHDQIGARWLPLLDSMVACVATDAYRPLHIGLADLTVSRFGVIQSLYGWAVVTDPLPASTTADPARGVATLDQAQALGWLLSHGDIDALVSDDEIAWLDSTLVEIARRPMLADAFLTNLTTNGWTHLCNRLGDDRITLVAERTITGHLGDPEQRRLAGIDGIVATLGAMLVDDHQRHPHANPLTLLSDMTPYAAASLVQHLHLESEALASISTTLITRYREGGWSDVQRPGPGTADILIQIMLDTPGASKAFVMAHVSDPAMLLDAPHEAKLAEQLLLSATSHANMTLAESAVAIPALTRFIRDRYNSGVGFYGQFDPDVTTFGVDLIAPWLLQFTAAHAADWNLGSGETARLLASIIVDDAAFARLMSRRDDVAAGVSTRLATSSDAARHSVADLAALVGLVDTLARKRGITNASEAMQLWDTAFAAVSTSTSFLPGGIVATVGTGVALHTLRVVLDDRGVTPLDGPIVAHDTLHQLDWLTAVAAATVVCATFDQMVANGRISADALAPPVPDAQSATPGAAYSAAFARWLDNAHLGDQAVLLDDIKQTMMSAHEAERNATELSTR